MKPRPTAPVPRLSLTIEESGREEWMNKRQLAAHLGVGPRTVERLKLPCLLVGGQNRYRVSEVETELRRRQGIENVVPLRRTAA